MDTHSKTYTVITGASSGIGRAAAKEFAKRGSGLILVARRKERLDALAQELRWAYSGVDVLVRAADLSDPKACISLYEEVKTHPLRTWVNNAGFGYYASVAAQEVSRVQQMLRLNTEALTTFSTLYVRDFKDIEGTQLINVSSAGGYTVVPNAVTYCATKFYVSAFTEGLAAELKDSGAKMLAKVLAPAATQTEFGQVANGVDQYDYDQAFGVYHTAQQMAAFLMELYDSKETVGVVDRERFSFCLCGPRFPYAGNSGHNQRL